MPTRKSERVLSLTMQHDDTLTPRAPQWDPHAGEYFFRFRRMQEWEIVELQKAILAALQS